MQHLGARRAHARALAGRQHDRREAGPVACSPRRLRWRGAVFARQNCWIAYLVLDPLSRARLSDGSTPGTYLAADIVHAPAALGWRRFARCSRKAGTIAYILVVESDPDLQRRIGDALREGPYELAAETEASWAKRSIAVRTPDAVILDTSLSDGPGFALAEELRSDPDTRARPIIFIASRRSAARTTGRWRAAGTPRPTYLAPRRLGDCAPPRDFAPGVPSPSDGPGDSRRRHARTP